MPNNPLLENQIPEWGNGNTAKQAIHAQFPSLLPFSCACIDAGHEEQNVEGGEGVEDLQREVPFALPAVRGRRSEDVEITRAKNKGIKRLCNERDACGRESAGDSRQSADLRLTFRTAVGVDSPYQDQLRSSMRHIPEDVKNVEPHVVTRWLHETGRGRFSASAGGGKRDHAVEV